MTAEVRTWDGQALRLSQPSLEVFYTIVSKSQESSGSGGSASIGQVSGGATGHASESGREEQGEGGRELHPLVSMVSS